MRVLEYLNRGVLTSSLRHLLGRRGAPPQQASTDTTAGNTTATGPNSSLQINLPARPNRPDPKVLLTSTPEPSNEELHQVLKDILCIKTDGFWREDTKIDILAHATCASCRNRMGYFDGRDYDKERLPKNYTFYDVPDEEKIFRITKELFGTNYRDYRKVFEERKIPQIARVLYREILYKVLKHQKDEELKQSLLYLLKESKVPLPEAQRRDSDVYARARELFLDSDETSGILLHTGDNQEDFCKNQGSNDANAIWEYINEWGYEGFKDALRALEDLTECKSMCALNGEDLSYKPNLLSLQLDTIQSDVAKGIQQVSKAHELGSLAGSITKSTDEELDRVVAAQPIEQICKAVHELTTQICREAIEKERVQVAALEKIRSRRRWVKGTVGGAVLLTTGVALVGGYTVRSKYKEAARLKELTNVRKPTIERLKKEIDSCVNFFNVQAIAEMDEKKKAGKDPNEVYFRTLAAYLERPPQEKELQKELKYFLDNYNNILSSPITLDPEVKTLLENYLKENGEKGKITSDELADALLEILPQRKIQLPNILQSLQVIRYIRKNGMPDGLEELNTKEMDTLRSLFHIREWNNLYNLQGQIAPTIQELIGSSILYEPGNGVLYDLVQAKKGEDIVPPIFINDTGHVNRMRHNVKILREGIEKVFVTETKEYKDSSEAKSLLYLQEKLDSTKDLEALEALERNEIRPLINSLNQRRMKLNSPYLLALARCLERAKELERIANEDFTQWKVKETKKE